MNTVSNGNLFSASLVEPRMSTNMLTRYRSWPIRCGCEDCALPDIRCGMNNWKNDRSRSGLSWHASRIEGSVAPTRLSTKASRWDGSGNELVSPLTRMRHVEQRARPPHTLACGTL